MNTKLAILLTATTLAIASAEARADFHLELGVSLSPTIIADDAYGFFSADSSVMNSGGFDLRVEALEIAHAAHLLPFVSWRGAMTDGGIIVNDQVFDTGLRIHDLYGGLRMKGWLLSWLGVYGQVGAGVSIIRMEATWYTDTSAYPGTATRYEDQKSKLLLTAGLGVELRISPKVLEKRGVKRFNFGGEIGAGFVRRAQTHFKARADGGDDWSLPIADAVNFGDINLTGWAIQAGLNFHFF